MCELAEDQEEFFVCGKRAKLVLTAGPDNVSGGCHIALQINGVTYEGTAIPPNSIDDSPCYETCTAVVAFGSYEGEVIFRDVPICDD